MRKQTTTKQLNESIANNLLQITKAECHYKSSNRIDELSKEELTENIQSICDSGVFADCIGWHYGTDAKSNGYIAECGRMNPDVEIIMVVYLDICEGVNVEDIDRTLLYTEE